MKIDENEVYTTKEVAEILKVSLPTIKRMLKDKRLPSTRIGKQHRFLGKDLMEILTIRRDLRDSEIFDVPRPERGEKPSAAEAEPDYVRKMSSTERRQRAYMLGRKTKTAILADDGTVLVEAGVVVDDITIRLARAHRKMMELFGCLEYTEEK